MFLTVLLFGFILFCIIGFNWELFYSKNCKDIYTICLYKCVSKCVLNYTKWILLLKFKPWILKFILSLMHTLLLFQLPISNIKTTLWILQNIVFLQIETWPKHEPNKLTLHYFSFGTCFQKALYFLNCSSVFLNVAIIHFAVVVLHVISWSFTFVFQAFA